MVCAERGWDCACEMCATDAHCCGSESDEDATCVEKGQRGRDGIDEMTEDLYGGGYGKDCGS